MNNDSPLRTIEFSRCRGPARPSMCDPNYCGVNYVICSITLLIFACAVVLFVADVLPMRLVVFSVPLALDWLSSIGFIGSAAFFASEVSLKIHKGET